MTRESRASNPSSGAGPGTIRRDAFEWLLFAIRFPQRRTRLTRIGRELQHDEAIDIRTDSREPGFFPDHLAKEGREEMLGVLGKAGIKAITLAPEQSKFGSVETHDDAIKCGDLFRAHRDEIDGIIVTLPNFGDERGIADSIRYSTLEVPVLVQATPDRRDDMKITDRRDSFCGKMLACNNLMQYGIPYSITAKHTVQPSSAEFGKDLDWFAKVCRVTNGLKKLRIGAIGARPQAFNTVRYSEKLLEAVRDFGGDADLSDIFGAIGRMKDDEPDVKAKLAAIRALREHEQRAGSSADQNGEAGDRRSSGS